MWKKNVIELYNYYKNKKTKASSIACKKIFGISDSYRDKLLKIELKHSMQNYSKNYLSWKEKEKQQKNIKLKSFQTNIYKKGYLSSYLRESEGKNILDINDKRNEDNKNKNNLKNDNETNLQHNNLITTSKAINYPHYIFIPSKEKFKQMITNAAGISLYSPKAKFIPSSFSSMKT